ncbi:hypothetical protein FY528_02815 [Hymenobacter lutimineralis]|uniref:DUF6630 domain-containing protein n=1 Tax=Hymenobacter lutimineralis TaxID=2606448 RepID=A0A5D6VF83_9BACT|nr:hypothetical protein [Hymenobacter lutimineralis]TYZ13358.1 hypothetical protein FY528_02815 [Hymenobacter lutimineralis]
MTTLAADVTELLTLLTTGTLAPEELVAATETVVLAAQDPDAYFEQYLNEEEHSWLLDCGASMTEVALSEVLEQELCRSDKADELYEQISEQFREPLPAAPPHYRYLREYLQLLDAELQQRGPQPGGYELLEFGDSYSDELQVLLVFRKDTPRLLELGQQLGIHIARPQFS